MQPIRSCFTFEQQFLHWSSSFTFETEISSALSFAVWKKKSLKSQMHENNALKMIHLNSFIIESAYVMWSRFQFQHTKRTPSKSRRRNALIRCTIRLTIRYSQCLMEEKMVAFFFVHQFDSHDKNKSSRSIVKSKSTENKNSALQFQLPSTGALTNTRLPFFPSSSSSWYPFLMQKNSHSFKHIVIVDMWLWFQHIGRAPKRCE